MREETTPEKLNIETINTGKEGRKAPVAPNARGICV